MLAACTTAFTACNNEEALPDTGNQLKLSFGINAPQSRAIFTDTKLPDSSPVGVTLDGYADYANLVYTGTTESGKQTWTPDKQVRLSDTQGTLYAYWPYSSTTSINAIEVDMTAENQTDWLYATPVTGICEDKAEADVTMNHALANINVTVNKGTYLGEGNISNITLQSDGIALGGTFNAAQATPEYTAFENEGEPLSRNVTTTTGTATDIMVVPTGTSAAVTFLLTIDGTQFTAKSADVTLEKGNSYQYTLNLSDISTYMTIGSFGVTPWGSVAKDNLDLEEYDEFDEGIVATYYVDEASLTSRAAGVEVQILSSSSDFKLDDIVRMKVDGIEITPTLTYIFDTPGEHTVKFLLKDNKTIPYESFYNCTRLRSIKIPNSVTSIEKWAFQNCTGLTEVTIPNSVQTIGKGAFYGCTGITSLEFGSSVRTIGEKAFYQCTGLTEVTIPNSVTNVEERVFQGCKGLISVTIPNSVKSIGKYMFCECTELTNVTIPNSVTSIGEYAFNKCEGLTSINIPNSVTGIGRWAFLNCTGLTEITIPNSVTSIEKQAFMGCTGLKRIFVEEGNTFFDSRYNCNAIMETTSNTLVLGCINTVIPKDCQIIGEYAFYCCEGITEVNIPNSVTSIGENAFADCSGLTSLDLGTGVQNIGYGAFCECSGLNVITSNATTAPVCHETAFLRIKSGGKLIIPKECTDAYAAWMGTGSYYLGNYGWFCLETDNYVLEEGIYYSTDGKILLGSDKSISGNIIIKEGVNSIGNAAFFNCKNLNSITLPNSVTSIGMMAFQNCTGLTSLDLGIGVQTIGNRAFSYCTGLTEGNIPNSVTSIGEKAFYECSGLKSIDLGAGLINIGIRAFAECSKVTKITSRSITAPIIQKNVFEDVYPKGNLYVPTGASGYDEWKGFLCSYSDYHYWNMYFSITE